MKNLIKIKIWTILTVFIFAMFGCSSDFLNRPPIDSIVDAGFYQTDDQVMAGTALLYSLAWFNFNDKASYSLAEFRSGVLTDMWGNREHIKFAVTPESDVNLQAWQAFYNVIGQANTARTNIERYAGSAVSEKVKNEAIGETHFMHALALRYLVMNYGEVPIITDNQALLADPLSVRRNTISSIWKFICTEMRQAVDELPETPYAVGRVTKWSAEGMLARFYLTRAGVESDNGQRNQQFLDSAKYYADRVIKLSGKKLMPTYRDLFLAAPNGSNYNNNNESLFELQWLYTPGGTYGYNNSTISQIAPDNTITGNGDAWGGSYTATFWMLSQYEGIAPYGTTGDSLQGRTLDQRLHETFFMPGSVYPEITRIINGVSQNPFVFPNNTLGSSFDGGGEGDPSPACIKKYIIGNKVDVGGNSGFQNYPNDTYMMRLAEMYLIYAEAALGNNPATTDPTAIEYFNAVHTRAGLPAWDTSAQGQGPLTWDKIFQERCCEFAMEATIWYDLVQLHYWNPQKTFDIIASQYRGIFSMHPDVFPNPTKWTIVKTTWGDVKNITASDGNFKLPIPAKEAVAAPNLQLPAVDYYAQ